MAHKVLFVISGSPASGKTTVAEALRAEMNLPVLSKDIIKEVLFDVLGVRDQEWSRQLGRAAIQIMMELASHVAPAILDSHFWPGESERELMALGIPIVQIYCDCPVHVAVERYLARAESGQRHAGHEPPEQRDEIVARWTSLPHTPLLLEAPLVHLDTSVPLDVRSLMISVDNAVAQL